MTLSVFGLHCWYHRCFRQCQIWGWATLNHQGKLRQTFHPNKNKRGIIRRACLEKLADNICGFSQILFEVIPRIAFTKKRNREALFGALMEHIIFQEFIFKSCKGQESAVSSTIFPTITCQTHHQFVMNVWISKFQDGHQLWRVCLKSYIYIGILLMFLQI